MAYGSKVKRHTPEGTRRRMVSHKIEMVVNNKQDSYLWQMWQYARKCYNFALGYHILTVKMKMPCFKLRVWLNRVKRSRFPWGAKLPQIPQKNIVYNLEQTLAMYYTKKKKGEPCGGYPRFKNYTEKPSIRIDNGRDNVPEFVGRKMILGRSWDYREWKLKEKMRFPEGDICQAVIIKEAGKWFVCVSVEILEKIPEIPEEIKDRKAGGDYGIGDTIFAYADDNEDKTWDNPRFYRNSEEEIAETSREIARSYKQNNGKLSNANKKRKERLSRLHKKVANQRADFLHKTTTEIVDKDVGIIITESLNANAWARSSNLGKSTHDAAPGTVHRMLAYKCEQRGKEHKQADRHYASTKTCSNLECGWFWRDMKLSDRTFICQQCGLILDRDINAARNLKQWKEKIEQPCSLGGDIRDSRSTSESSDAAFAVPYPQSKVLDSAKASQVRQLI